MRLSNATSRGPSRASSIPLRTVDQSNEHGLIGARNKHKGKRPVYDEGNDWRVQVWNGSRDHRAHGIARNLHALLVNLHARPARTPRHKRLSLSNQRSEIESMFHVPDSWNELLAQASSGARHRCPCRELERWPTQPAGKVFAQLVLEDACVGILAWVGMPVPFIPCRRAWPGGSSGGGPRTRAPSLSL